MIKGTTSITTSIQQKQIRKGAIYFLLMFLMNVAYSTPTNWNLYNHDFYNHSLTSKVSTEGQNSVIIKSKPIPINETTPNYLRDFEKQNRIGGVLFQTINASEFAGKHLHISTFAKYSPFNVEAFTKKYQRHLKNIPKDKIRKMWKNYRQYRFLLMDLNRSNFDTFFAKKSIGITVFAHQAEKVSIFEMTNPGNETPINWERFNTEIDVPTDTLYLTIILWIKGYGTAFFDHVVVAEQGDKLKQSVRTVKYQACSRCKKNTFLLYLKNTSRSKNTDFNNLSFEKHRN